MLFLISDLHLTDESTARNVYPAAFDIMKYEIESSIRGNDATELHLVFLGDIIDPMRTDYWQGVARDERPWNGSLDSQTAMNTHPAVEGHYRKVIERILATPIARKFLSVIDELDTGDIPKKVTYVVGNHDRVLNNYPSLQDLFREALPGDIALSFTTMLLEPRYGLMARHGHEWDAECHGCELYNEVLNPGNMIHRFDQRAYQVQTIGEVITAELMSGIVTRVRQAQEDGGTQGADLLKCVMDLNNVRPMTDAFVWLEWFSRQSLTDNDKSVVLGALKESISAVLETELAKQWDNIVREVWLLRGDITDRLDQVLSYIQGKTFEELKRSVKLFTFLQSIFESTRDQYVECAKGEWDHSLPPEIQYVAYGHTHQARHDFFAAGVDETVRMYLNTGTYLPLIERTSDHKGFARAAQLTMAVLCNSDEDREGRQGNGPTLSLWNGVKRKSYAS